MGAASLPLADRRTLLSGAAMATIIAATATAVPISRAEGSDASKPDPDVILVAALEKLQRARDAFDASPEGSDVEAAHLADETSAFDEIMATPAGGYAGLAVKARVLLGEVTGRGIPTDEASIAAQVPDLRYNEDRAAFGLALDILRLAREERERSTAAERSAA